MLHENTEAETIEIPPKVRGDLARMDKNPSDYQGRLIQFKIKGSTYGVCPKDADDDDVLDAFMETMYDRLNMMGMNTVLNKFKVEFIQSDDE